MNRVGSLFNVEPGEGRLVSLLFLHSFLLGTASNFVQTAAFALFMVEFDAQALALVYVVNALLLPTLTFLYLRLGRRLSFARLLAIDLGFMLLLIVAFRLGLGVGGPRAVTFGLPVLFQILANFGPLAFWTLVNRLFNLRQGKRLFGLTWAGYWLAIVLTGLLIPLLVSWLGTANLLLPAAGGMAGALVLLGAITRRFAGKLADSPAAGPAETKTSLWSLIRNRYVLLVYILVVLWWSAFFVLDNAFYGAAAMQYPSAERYASFLGLFLALLGVMTLISNALLTGPVISRYGLRVSLLILPVALFVVTGGMAVTGLAAGAVSLLFWLLVLNKLLDMAFGFSIDRSALSILYQPLASEQRRQAQTVAEGIVQPVANGLAGLLIFGLGALFASSTLPLIYVLLLIVAAWLVVAFLLGRQYPAMLMGALSQRRLGGADLSLIDGASLDVLQRGLQNPHPGVAVYSLRLLEAIDHESLPAFLQDALRHPAPEVRQTALQSIERLGLTAALSEIKPMITQEPVPGVRGAAIRALAALGASGACDDVCAYLDDPDPPVRQEAMVGLLRSGGIEGVLTAGHQLLQMAESREPTERVTAAQVLGQVGLGSFHQPLVPLLQDSEVEVRRAALRAAGELKNPKLWPLVIQKLASPAERRVAAAALVAGGESALPELVATLDQKGQPPQVQARLVRVCGRIGGEQATAWLKRHMGHPDLGVRTTVLRGLNSCGYQASDDEAGLVLDQIRAETALSAGALAWQVEIGEGTAVELLHAALEERLARSRERLFLLFSFLYNRRIVQQVRDNLALPSAERQAYALEVLDVLVSRELKELVFPLLADSAPSQKLQKLQARVRQPQWDRLRCLEEIIAASPGRFSAWTQSCALYAAGRLTAPALRDIVAAARSAPAALVSETASWALRHIDGVEEDHQEGAMLTTIEKVMALKQASIFAATPDETLAAIAVHLEEVPLRAGETIFEKGDLGDSMYIIVQGGVRVHDGGRTLKRLHAGEVFGEMAVLDAEPRMASVTALEDTQLLRLAQEPLYEVMEDRSEVGRGLIHVLSQRLRDTTQDLGDVRARLEALEG